MGQELYAGSGSTGLVLVVVRGRERTIATFGESYPGAGRGPTAESLLRLCSLTKVFTADLLVKLAQANLVRLDTPLQALAPNQARVPLRDAGRPMTLGDLATHTAGLPRELGPAPEGTPHFTYPGEETRWAWLPGQHLRTTPGRAALYSNLGFDLLGDALERAAHTPYPQLLAARTTNPLGMAETTFTPTADQCARLLLGAHAQGPCTATAQTAGSSGLYSTAADMERFLEYLVGAGAGAARQNPAAQAVYVYPANLSGVRGLDHAGEPTGIGLAWIHTPGSAGSDIVEKTGGGAGFSTYIAMLPEQHIALFFAATEGAGGTHYSLTRNANNVLLRLAGLPAMALPAATVEPGRPAAKRRGRRRHAS